MFLSAPLEQAPEVLKSIGVNFAVHMRFHMIDNLAVVIFRQIIPSLICIPAVAYMVGRSAGALPTRAEWQSAAHSSGPWMGSDVFTACYILSVGGLLPHCV